MSDFQILFFLNRPICRGVSKIYHSNVFQGSGGARGGPLLAGFILFTLAKSYKLIRHFGKLARVCRTFLSYFSNQYSSCSNNKAKNL